MRKVIQNIRLLAYERHGSLILRIELPKNYQIQLLKIYS